MSETYIIASTMPKNTETLTDTSGPGTTKPEPLEAITLPDYEARVHIDLHVYRAAVSVKVPK